MADKVVAPIAPTWITGPDGQNLRNSSGCSIEILGAEYRRIKYKLSLPLATGVITRAVMFESMVNAPAATIDQIVDQAALDIYTAANKIKV